MRNNVDQVPTYFLAADDSVSSWVTIQVFGLVGEWLYLHDHITLYEAYRELWHESHDHFRLLKSYEYTILDVEIEYLRCQHENECLFDEVGDAFPFYDSD
jgi:hypothetical protein